jgi:hypothetical protein
MNKDLDIDLPEVEGNMLCTLLFGNYIEVEYESLTFTYFSDELEEFNLEKGYADFVFILKIKPTDQNSTESLQDNFYSVDVRYTQNSSEQYSVRSPFRKCQVETYSQIKNRPIYGN